MQCCSLGMSMEWKGKFAQACSNLSASLKYCVSCKIGCTCVINCWSCILIVGMCCLGNRNNSVRFVTYYPAFMSVMPLS